MEISLTENNKRGLSRQGTNKKFLCHDFMSEYVNIFKQTYPIK